MAAGSVSCSQEMFYFFVWGGFVRGRAGGRARAWVGASLGEREIGEVGPARGRD